MTILQKIVKWNQERGLLEKGFNHQKEISFIIEELIESTGRESSIGARGEAELLASRIMRNAQTSNEAIVDALGDIIIFATGGIAKLGYNPDMVMEEVYKEINSRTGKTVDGKFIKDPNAQKYHADFTNCKDK